MKSNPQALNSILLFSPKDRAKITKQRLNNSRAAFNLTREQAHMQISRNGSVKSPNPYYRGHVKTDG
ncbi:MAG: hypothetical protein LDL31_10525 [Prosthecobacter sp.]|nr:hypothetical protein [Prosthecobacter sp.]